LDSSNLSVVSLALNAIGEACTTDMCRELALDVGRMMSNSFVSIKKKAALACIKIIKKCPELIDTFVNHLHSYFDYKNHGVLLAGCALANEIFKIDPSHIPKFTKYTPVFMKHLKNLISSNYSSEFDLNGVTDPFLQCQILSILKHFGKGNKDLSDEMKDILSDISTFTESSKLTSNAVQYELVKTIIGIQADMSLKSLASNILGRLLQSKDNNYKYISLNTLREVIKTDISSVQKHKNIILECLKDNDISICRRALELTFMIINNSNVKQIVKELINFLLIAVDEFKLELTTRTSQSIIAYGPNVKWQVDNLIKMMCMSGNFFSEDTVSSIINLIISNEELKIYAAHKLFLALKNFIQQEALVKVAVYILGEYGDSLVSNNVLGPEDEKIHVSEEEVIVLLREVENTKYQSSSVYEYLMNCFIKLSTKFSKENAKIIKQYINEERTSFYFEVQQRAVEYSAFETVVNDDLKRDLTRNIPCSKIHNKKQDIMLTDESENTEESDDIDKQLLIKYHESNNENVGNMELIGNIKSGSSLPAGINLLEDLNTLFIGNPSISELEKPISTDLIQNAIPDLINLPQKRNQQHIDLNIKSDFSQRMSPNSINLLSDVVNNSPSNNNYFPPNPLIDLGITSLTSSTHHNTSIGSTPNISQKSKEFYRNQYISISYTSYLNFDGSYSGYFYVSNNSDKFLSNVNLKFMVLTFLTFKVISSAGINLEPFQTQGVKKVRLVIYYNIGISFN
jgi:hypothetical protein